jgi:molecular chaperone GrpE
MTDQSNQKDPKDEGRQPETGSDAAPAPGEAATPEGEAAAAATAATEDAPPAAEAATTDETAAAAEPASKEEDPAPSGEPSAPAEPGETERLAEEVADLKDRLLRTAAEMENLRRRSEREIADARQYAISGFARELLAVGDNLGRALESVPGEAREHEGPLSTLLQGIEMTDRELHRVLEKHGVRKESPAGQRFDPHRHQAIFEIENGEVAPGTILQVIQPGYAIGERVLRPALVGVAKAPVPRPVETASAGGEDGGGTGEAAATAAAERTDGEG